MSEKRYKITTKTHEFESDNVGLDYLKEENGVFYAREGKSNSWQILQKLGKRTSLLEKWNDSSWIFGIIFYFGGYFLPYTERTTQEHYLCSVGLGYYF